MRTHPDVAGQPLSGSTRTAARVSEKVAVSVVFRHGDLNDFRT
jgi:hypothetical protein